MSREQRGTIQNRLKGKRKIKVVRGGGRWDSEACSYREAVEGKLSELDQRVVSPDVGGCGSCLCEGVCAGVHDQVLYSVFT